MARDAMARAFDRVDAVPPPPPQSFSRYRTLRGKSTSSPRQDFDVFLDGSSSPESNYVANGPRRSCLGSPRSRSKSVTTSFGCHLRQHESEPTPAVAPQPAITKVLCPKPINIAAQSKLKILESLKSPIFGPDKAPWRSLSACGLSKPTTVRNDDATHKRQEAAPAGAGALGGGAGAGAGGPAAATAAAARLALEPHRGQGPESHQDMRQEMSRHEAKVEETPDAKDEREAEAQPPNAVSKTVPEQKDRPNQEQEQDQAQAREQQKEPAFEPVPEHQPVSAPPDPDKESQSAHVVSKENPQPAQPAQPSAPRTSSAGEKYFASEIARLEAETDRILAEQKKLDLARLQAHLVIPPKPKRQILERLSFFTQTKRSTVSSCQPSTPSTIVSPIFSPALSHYSRDSSLEEPPTPSFPTTKMSFIEAGGKGIVPQTDAPISAINGGERRVIVRCLSSTINLPVTADTSPMDILTSAAESTRHHLTPPTCVVIECFFVLGLERRLRRYERIRDVMNSWDRDQQNSLLIMSCDTAQDDRDLDIESVPRTEEPPSGFSMQMYHSSKPGRWNKRWVTLLDNGQIYAAKTANAKSSDKESSVLCHLTDFDIYAPKESEMRRNLRPPKKFCYAIKSQQKTVVFPNGENFVHFFSTEDPQQAASFYEKVHGWRSWYMVNRMVDLDRKSKPTQLVLDAGTKSSGSSPNRNSIRNSHHKAVKSSDRIDEVTEEPLMDVNEFSMSNIVIDETPIQKSLSIRSKPSVRTRNVVTAPEIPRTLSEEEPEFSAGGLLGDAYEKRRQIEAMPPTSAANPLSKPADGPFTEAPSLLNGGISKSSSESSNISSKQSESEEKKEPKSWFPSAAEHSARIRHTHQQQRRPMTTDLSTSSTTINAGGVPRRDRHPTPLLNFSKDFPEPPRFQGGANTGMRRVSGQPLINFATGGPARDARDVTVRRNTSRRGLAPSNSGGGLAGAAPPPPSPQYPPPLLGMGPQRQQSKSNSQRRHYQHDAHLVPPRHLRRPHHGGPPSRPPPGCPPEPLVNRAR